MTWIQIYSGVVAIVVVFLVGAAAGGEDSLFAPIVVLSVLAPIFLAAMGVI